MKQIGVTGGIGSGKSIVCKLFSVLGIPVYWADERAKWLIENDEALKKSIIETLGKQAYLPDGKYNRRWVAEQVFQQPHLLKQLNGLVHPAVATDRAAWLTQQQAAYVVQEAAIMNKAGDGNNLDKVIVVLADKDVRIARTLHRDAFRTLAEVEKIMASQRSDESFKEIADLVISNNPTDRLLPQVLAIHQQFLKEAAEFTS